ncbi:PadR family transcriptional regulator [Halomonas halmophila]|uniref:Transcription regulator PadR N-terminal domain-containing protein n=1 Tax=Halomonas halmophila TaxID=252 RepID=A0A4Y4EWJ8_9GAMM|nr:PadR family transcriptional regulator [Halomonas halmophila]GED21503.1 hypothetical protein HHA01_04800 [Halomonas halmophila]
MPDSFPDHADPTTARRHAPSLPLGMPATRKLSAEDLGILVLSLIEEADSYGSQLSERIEQLSNGFYRPSPGTLYPALKSLSEHGLLCQQRQGRRKYYRITPPGRDWLALHRQAAERVSSRLQNAGRKLTALYASMSEALDDDALALPLAQEMLSARMDLKAALHESRHASPDAQRRVLRLLQDTAERIRAEADSG